jgi:hypothetical protein
VLGREVAVAVVLGDPEAVLLRQLQHAVGVAGDRLAPVGLCSTLTLTNRRGARAGVRSQ